MKKHILTLLLLIASVGAQAEPAGACGAPAALDDGWTIAGPEEVGLDGVQLCDLDGFLKQWPTANIHALVVVRHGKLVVEHYRTGRDLRFAGEDRGVMKFSPTGKHDIRSISKSTTELLVGIALGEGQYPGLGAPVFDSFPEYAELRTPEKTRITFRHLLTMSPGLKWDENAAWTSPNNTERPMFEAADPFRYTLGQPVAVAPGTVFNYSGGASSLLGRVLAKSTGRRIDDYAREKLFGPLSITDFEWLPFANSPEIAAFGGLRLRPRDLAKLGQLMASGGRWNGRQVVPADWIAESVKPRLNTDGSLLYYGYQWWLGRSLLRGRDLAWIGGIGNGGQRLYVVPDLDLVVAINSAHYGSPLQGTIPISILNRFVLPAVQD
jgi:CubicO group peptidase (beta-lactamase class C family)